MGFSKKQKQKVGLLLMVTFNHKEDEVTWQNQSFLTLAKLTVSHVAVSILMAAKMAASHVLPLRLPRYRFLTNDPVL